MIYVIRSKNYLRLKNIFFSARARVARASSRKNLARVGSLVEMKKNNLEEALKDLWVFREITRYNNS